MKPVKGERSNFTFGPPPGQEDSVGSLECRREMEDGIQVTYSVWRPSPEELALLNEGALIELGIFGPRQIPPVSLNVTDEQEAE